MPADRVRQGAPRASYSSCEPPQSGRPEQGEVRIQGERAARPGGGVATEAALDLGAVEQLRAVLGPKTERELGVAERLPAALVPGERPGEHVVAVDRGALALRLP